MAITIDNFNELDHISDAELESDIKDIMRENEGYRITIEGLNYNRQAFRTQIYLTEGRILANEAQLKDLTALQMFRLIREKEATET